MPKTAKIESLEKKLEQIKAQLAAEKAREKAQKRKDETRRKILVGAYFIDQAQTEKKMSELVEKLDPFLKKAADRKLFDLPPISEQKPKVSETEPEISEG
jgi:hypothetical protein